MLHGQCCTRSWQVFSVKAGDRLRIAPATESDLPIILEMVRRLAEFERVPHRFLATRDTLCNSMFGARAFAEAAIAYVGDQPAGVAVYFHTFSTFSGLPGLFLEDLFVESPWRGQGVGKQLLAHVARLAVERGCDRLDWSVLDWNDPAIGFYRGVGAAPVDGWINYRLTGDALTQLAKRTDSDG